MPFAPVLKAYITSESESAIIPGDIQSPVIWTQDLAQIDEDTAWDLTRDASNDYKLSPADIQVKVATQFTNIMSTPFVKDLKIYRRVMFVIVLTGPYTALSKKLSTPVTLVLIFDSPDVMPGLPKEEWLPVCWKYVLTIHNSHSAAQNEFILFYRVVTFGASGERVCDRFLPCSTDACPRIGSYSAKATYTNALVFFPI